MTRGAGSSAPPPAPGEVLREYILDAHVTQEKLAQALDVSRFSVNQIINGRRAVTAEMALRLSRVTSTTPQMWLELQARVDLFNAKRKLGDRIEQLEILRPAKLESELFVDQ